MKIFYHCVSCWDLRTTPERPRPSRGNDNGRNRCELCAAPLRPGTRLSVQARHPRTLRTPMKEIEQWNKRFDSEKPE